MPGVGEYAGVILAAGRGRRMGELGDDYSKALLPVANEALIVYHLKLMHTIGVRNVYVVVGHRVEDVVQTIGDDSQYGLSITYVEQGKPLGIAHALAQVRPYIHIPFFVCLGDYYFSSPNPAGILARSHEASGSAVVALAEPNQARLSQGCALKTDHAGRVVDVVEKPHSPKSGTLRSGGFYVFQPTFFDAITRTPRTALRDEYELTTALDIYVKSGFEVFAEKIVTWDTNFTHPDDVIECNLRWLRDHGMNSLCHADAEVNIGATLDHVVIGAHAHITRATRMNEVVVFPNASFDGHGALFRSLITPTSLIECDAQTS
jgi:dTDP-glucose pyrophosphorylase